MAVSNRIYIPHDVRNALVYLKLLEEQIQHGEAPDSEDLSTTARHLRLVRNFMDSVDLKKQDHWDLSDSFSRMKDEYQFFQDHSNEAEKAINAMTPIIESFLTTHNGKVNLLDFGCGDGRASSMLLSQLTLDPAALNISLVDIDAAYLKSTVEAVSPFSQYPIRTSTSLDLLPSGSFQLLIANHSLYYVNDLEKTISSIHEKMTEHSLLLVTLANKSNGLYVLNKHYYDIHNVPYPKHVSEDFESILLNLKLRYRKESILSWMQFQDSLENRMKVISFVNGGNRKDFIKHREMLDTFEDYKIGPKINFTLTDDLFILRK